jgi:hypothetical protein
VNGQLSLGTNAPPGAQLLVAPNAATTKGMIVQGFASQTANLQEWQDSTGTVFASIDSLGRLGIGAASTDTSEAIKLANNKVISFSFANPASGSAFFLKADTSDQGQIFTSSFAKSILINGSSILLNNASGGKVSINEVNPDGQLQVTTNATTTKGLTIKGTASQTANLQEWQNSTGTALATITSSGVATFSGIATAISAIKTTAYTITTNDSIVLTDTSSGDFAVTLPAASGVIIGRQFTVKSTTTGTATVTAAVSDTIDGSGTYPLASANKYVTVASDGSSKWYVIANN